MIGWYISIFSMGLILFGTYPNLSTNPGNFLNKTENILYQASSRVIWSMGLGFIIFSCANGKGGFVNDFLCWKIWTPLARISFCAYLVHSTVLFWYLGQQLTLSYWQEINVVFLKNFIFNKAKLNIMFIYKFYIKIRHINILGIWYLPIFLDW